MVTVPCPSCGEPNPRESSTCTACGTSLAEGATATPVSSAGPTSAATESTPVASDQDDEPGLEAPVEDGPEPPSAGVRPPDGQPDHTRAASESEELAKPVPETSAGFRPLAGISEELPLETIMALPRRSELGLPPGPSSAEVHEAELMRRMLAEDVAVDEPHAVGPGARPGAVPARPVRLLIYVALIAAIVAGLVWRPNWPGGDPEPRPGVRDLFESIELLPRNATVLLCFDYDPGTAGELEPLARAVINHLTRRDSRLLVVSTVATGILTGETLLDEVVLTRDMVYGEDYLVLGYLPGDDIGLRQLAGDLAAPFITDYYLQRPLAEFEIMESIPDVRRVSLAVDLAGDAESIRRWIGQVQGPYRVPMVAAVSAAAGPRAAPYYASGQLRGLASGLSGAAEYETLLARPGNGIATADAQTLAYLMVLGAIVLGNLAHLAAWVGAKRAP